MIAVKDLPYKLEFEEATHTYRVNGVVKPGISEILKTLKLSKDFTGIDPYYRDRGIAVHKCIELWLKDDLDLASIDEACKPYFEGFLSWWGNRPKDIVQASEIPLYHKELDYCGTLDLVVNDTIIDYKCSKMQGTVAKQNGTAKLWEVQKSDDAYELQGLLQQGLWLNHLAQFLPFRLLQLPGDGTWRMLQYSTRNLDLAHSIINLYNWKVRR